MRISNEKKEKIEEQILSFLYSINPQAVFTSKIAFELIRDEEFIKKLLLDLKEKRLIIEIKKNPQGKKYSRRSRWKLTKKSFENYHKVLNQTVFS